MTVKVLITENTPNCTRNVNLLHELKKVMFIQTNHVIKKKNSINSVKPSSQKLN